jgi:hypothetical protein
VSNDSILVASPEDITPETQALAENELEQSTPAEPEIPEKYRGKSVQEIIEMHSNAERELGRARNEVGTVRKLADELLGIHRSSFESASTPKPKERAKLTTDALFDDPDRAITEIVREERAQVEQALEARLARSEKALALQEFEKRHPGYKDLMEDEDFTGWIQASPHRMRLAAAAVQDDFMAADELFSTYEEIREYRSKAPPKTKPTNDPRQAQLARSGGSNAAGVVGTGTGKKIWSRTELIEMRIRDPQKFDSLYESEILPAYQENRVK